MIPDDLRLSCEPSVLVLLNTILSHIEVVEKNTFVDEEDLLFVSLIYFTLISMSLNSKDSDKSGDIFEGNEVPAEEVQEQSFEHYDYRIGEVVSLATDGGFVKFDNDFLLNGEGILIKMNGLIIQGYWKHGNLCNQLIISDISSKTLKGVYTMANGIVKTKIDVSNVENNRKLDLEDKVWKGQVLNDQPFGWGELFTKEGNLEYTGFMVQTKMVCYGTIYNYDDSQQYKGTIWNNFPFGAGTIFASNGKCVYDGGMIDGTHQYSGVLKVPNNVQYVNGLHSLLEEIYIGNSCFIQRYEFIISGFTFLRVLTIGNDCFARKRMNVKARNDSTSMYIINCPYLETITIGQDSFPEFSSCNLRGLPLLQKLTIGSNSNSVGCFINCYEFMLEGIVSIRILN